jgi:hypothetical protein
MTANDGSDLKKVADFTISDFSHSFTGGPRIALASPFDYNPRNGNLLP